MRRLPTGMRKGRVLLLVAAAFLLLALFPRGPVGLDIAVNQAGGHALLKLGAATIRIAFDSGRQCPNSNSCNGILP